VKALVSDELEADVFPHSGVIGDVDRDLREGWVGGAFHRRVRSRQAPGTGYPWWLEVGWIAEQVGLPFQAIAHRFREGVFQDALDLDTEQVLGIDARTFALAFSRSQYTGAVARRLTLIGGNAGWNLDLLAGGALWSGAVGGSAERSRWSSRARVFHSRS